MALLLDRWTEQEWYFSEKKGKKPLNILEEPQQYPGHMGESANRTTIRRKLHKAGRKIFERKP